MSLAVGMLNIEVLLVGGSVIVATGGELDELVLGLNTEVGPLALLMPLEVTLTLAVILVVVVLMTLGIPLLPSLGE